MHRVADAAARPDLELDALRRELDDALRLAEEADHATVVTALLCLRGELAGGSIAGAEADLRACARRARDEGDLQRAAEYTTRLGRFLRDQDRVDEAAARLVEGRALARESGSRRAALGVSIFEADLAWRYAPLAEARARAAAVIDEIEAIAADEADRRDGGARQGGLSDVFRRQIGELLRHPERGALDLELAFAFGERMRADALRGRLGVDGPAPPPDLATVRASLPRGEALLVYQLAGEVDVDGASAGGSWLWVITRDAVEVAPLPARGRLAAPILGFAGAFAARDGGEEAAGVGLHAALLAPALARLGPEVQTLIVVPDQELHVLPFAALRPAVGAPPLLADHVVAVVPSVAAWLRWRAAPPAATRRVVGLADPTPPASTEAPPSAEALPLPEALPPLPGARAELEAMATALDGRAILELHVGDEATEPALRRALPGAALIHVAAHTWIDSATPADSAILLAPGDRREARSDGALTLAETLEIDAADAWIVLAACSADSGPLIPGEGLEGLAQAWLRAGARGVIAARWPIRDDEARAIFVDFYAALAEGASVGEALRDAQRAAIDRGAPAEAWAGLHVLGDPGARPLPRLDASSSAATARGLSPAALVALILGALALTLVALTRRRGSRPTDAAALRRAADVDLGE
ncbi:MAG: CHAT domain-containing protein [Nannocystaceae bacterium]